MNSIGKLKGTSMPNKIKLNIILLLMLPNVGVHATVVNQIPPECRNLSHTVAMIDCLQNQLEILKFALDYHETASKIENLLSNQTSPAPAAIEKESSESELVLDRINWFDQNLEIYAIVGSPERLTALGRLNGRHYRLREGDSIRLAKVKAINPRGVILTFSDREFSIGLSGRPVSSNINAKQYDQ